ncbi:hypothetical protein JG676_05655 [Campylobacter sp. 2018MI35]|uniref:hypothetical protein n=1 Tax=Campylobacter sp. 2018MI34 TaxID=2800582 RepID=UPI001908F06F|nr:hypothetical protein [Campylobacter sp. 2018MI34]MBK1992084.1 hypothetical protein [Campylobacter sp. 2018MI34]
MNGGGDLKKLSFIDEVLHSSNFFQDLSLLNPDIFISIQRSSSFFKELKKLKLKKCIVNPHFISLTSSYFTTPFPYFRSKKYMSKIALKLVKAINAKHYDKNILKIDFSKVKDFLPNDDSLSKNFLKNLKYEKIIAINPFSNNSEYRGVNFFIKDWLNLTRNLAKNHRNFLFILLNFDTNPIQINIKESNLKIFVNNDNIASLVSISKKIDFFISVDTGNVHLCDILQIPSLVFISKLAAFRFSGGSYKGKYDSLVVDKGWQKKI